MSDLPMSRDLWEIGHLKFTEFYGGTDRGICIQIVGPGGYVQLSAREFERIRPYLDRWVGGAKRGWVWTGEAPVFDEENGEPR